MRPRLYFISTLLTLCVLTVKAQGKLAFADTLWDFGTIRESDGRVSCLFNAQNRSTKPLVLLDVVTSCGCTAPEFSRKPILPGQQTQIRITFDPTNRPGAFSKELAVYSSERKKISTLTIRGTVIARQKSPEELYPLEVGSGLRLSSGLCSFAYLYHGQRVQSALGYLNTSSRPLTLALHPVESSGMLKIDYPRQIAAGEHGQINISYTLPAQSNRYGTVKDLLMCWVDGRDSGIPLLVHAIAIDLPSDADQPAPQLQLEQNTLKFGTLKRTTSTQQLPLLITNQGTAPLTIRAVECDGRLNCSLHAGQQIAPGQSLTAQVQLTASEQEYGILVSHITLITNDPIRPMRKIRVTAMIED